MLALIYAYLILVVSFFPVVVWAVHAASSGELRVCFRYMNVLLENLTSDESKRPDAKHLFGYWRWVFIQSLSHWRAGAILGIPVILGASGAIIVPVLFAAPVLHLIVGQWLDEPWSFDKHWEALTWSGAFSVTAFIGGWHGRKFIMLRVEQEIEDLERGVDKIAEESNRFSDSYMMRRVWYRESDGRWIYYPDNGGPIPFQLKWPATPRFKPLESGGEH